MTAKVERGNGLVLWWSVNSLPVRLTSKWENQFQGLSLSSPAPDPAPYSSTRGLSMYLGPAIHRGGLMEFQDPGSSPFQCGHLENKTENEKDLSLSQSAF